jgi:hypothetical protein
VPSRIIWGEESVETRGSWTLIPQTVSIKKSLKATKVSSWRRQQEKMEEMSDQLDPKLRSHGMHNPTRLWFLPSLWTTIPVLIAQPKDFGGSNVLNHFRLEGSLKWHN